MNLREFGKAWGLGNDCAHPVRANFVAAKPEEFTSETLNLVHAKTEAHQFGAKRHHTAAQHARKTTCGTSSFDRGFSARNLFDQRTHLINWPLLTKEPQDRTDGFFSHSFIDAGFCSQSVNEFVH